MNILETQVRRLTSAYEVCSEVEKQLNIIHDGFKAVYDENERTFRWINKDIDFHFDMYSSARLYRELVLPRSLVSLLIKYIYKVNDFMILIDGVKTKIERFINNPLKIKFAHLADYNGSYVSPKQIFYFCPINIFLNFKTKKRVLNDLTEHEHVSVIFSHEYGHHLFDLESDTILTVSKFCKQLKNLTCDKEILLEKIKEHIIQNEEDAWKRGRKLALKLGVREEIYQKYISLHLDYLASKDKTDFKNNLYPYFKWNSDGSLKHSKS